MNNSKEATSVNQQQNDEPLRYSTPSFLSDLHLRSTEVTIIIKIKIYLFNCSVHNNFSKKIKTRKFLVDL